MPPRVAVVGHAEWVTFARVPQVPRPGEIVRASEVWREPGGGGGIVAVLLAAMAGGCEFWTVAGEGLAAALAAHGMTVHAEPVAGSRRIFTQLDDAGERTITVLGDRLDPAAAGVPGGVDGVFVTAGAPAAVTAARRAWVLVATPRAGPVLAGVDVDALVWSAADPAECAAAARLGRAGLRVMTRGAGGGTWQAADGTSGGWDAAAPPGRAVDTFGCGDAFAAGLTFALACRLPIGDAVGFAAQCGAVTLTGRGSYGALGPLREAARALG